MHEVFESATTLPADVDSDHDAEDDEGNPPDGGWGWVVVFGSMLSTAANFLIRMSFSILYMEWVDYFQSDKGQTGWIGSLFLSTGSILGTIHQSSRI